MKYLEATGYENLHEVPSFIYEFGEKQGYNSADIVLHCIDNSTQKLHTIRKDEKNRWKPGNPRHLKMRMNPYNPLSYIVIVISIVVLFIMYGFKGTFEKVNLKTAFKWY